MTPWTLLSSRLILSKKSLGPLGSSVEWGSKSKKQKLEQEGGVQGHGPVPHLSLICIWPRLRTPSMLRCVQMPAKDASGLVSGFQYEMQRDSSVDEFRMNILMGFISQILFQDTTTLCLVDGGTPAAS